MANNEGVDIIIKATDQYTKTINNITASNELMGKSVKSVQKELDANIKLWTTLRVQGLDPASASMKVLEMNAQQLTFTLNSMKTAGAGAGAAIGSSAATLKKSNQQWTNLALVVQDLPFGFRGIQNNLPALIGSVAGAGGALYFAGSAIIALFTAWDLGLFGTTKKTKELKDETDSLIGSMSQEATKVNSLLGVLRNENETRERKNRAIKELQNINPDIFKGLKLEGDKVRDLNKFYSAYIENLKNAILLKQDELELEKIIKAELKTKPVLTPLPPGNPLATGKKLLEETNGIVRSIDNYTGQINLGNKKIINNLAIENKGLSRKAQLLENIAKRSGSVELGNGGAGPNKKAPVEKKTDFSKSFEDLAQEEYNFYKDSIFRAEEYFIKLNNLQKYNALQEAIIKGASSEELIAIEKTYDQKYLNFLQSHQSKVFDVLHQGQQLNKKLTDDYNKEKLDGQVTYTNNYIKSLDAQLKAELRLHRNNVVLQQENIKNKISQLKFAQVFAAGNVKATQDINAELLRLNSTLTGVGTNWANTANRIVSIANDFLANSFVSLGETIGQALAGEKVQPFVALAEILASSLIELGKALISFAILEGTAFQALKDPTKWPIALAAGVAAVAAGAFLKAKLGKDKTKKFANGGIISGPTMGLMGEYPGAANNPEVVAPLDKLKDMIGGGSGTLEARISGNDLLILMNKASRNNNNTF
jgi:hypothetical protein